MGITYETAPSRPDGLQENLADSAFKAVGPFSFPTDTPRSP